ncbi:MAG: RHS repeat-associated core domain-containing protein [Tepidisphaeraceae bacterium]
MTTVGSDTDNAVLQIFRTYEVRGMMATITSTDSASQGSGTVLNQVKLEYNTFSQLIKEYQAHGGAVNTSTSPKVQYGYATGASSSNQIRPTGLTYPNGRAIDFNYGSGGSLEDYLNRVAAIKDGATSLAAYTYLGADAVIRIDYTQPDVMLDLWGGTSGQFDGFDRFDRIIDQRWKYYGGSPADRDRYKYGYDRNSSRIWKQNCVGSTLDEFYSYDSLNRLAVMQRGTLIGSPPTGISGTPVRELDWTLDLTGNWPAYLTKTSGTTDLNQTRTANTVNEITGITASGGTPNWADPAYDAAGNTTAFPEPSDPTQNFTAVYDAWDRMVSVSSGDTTVATSQYDGRNRRIIKVTISPSETRHFYFSDEWQDVEERVGSSSTADQQYIWGIRYVDELVCRDRTVGGSDERLYAMQDANFNLTAICSTSGTIVERYVFDPYGSRSIRNPSWGVMSSGAYASVIGHQGLVHDDLIGLLYNRNRWLNPLFGQFTQRDLAEYANGPNLYEYLGNSPPNESDPDGLLFGRKARANASAFVQSLVGMLLRAGIRQTFRMCMYVPQLPGSCACLIGTVEITEQGCCRGNVTALCTVVSVHVDVGLFVCASLSGGDKHGLPGDATYGRGGFGPIASSPSIPRGRILGGIAGIHYNCPAEGWSGSVCITASAGFASFTYGARGCYDFKSGKYYGDAGLGVGYGTGISGGGALTYTKCDPGQ